MKISIKFKVKIGFNPLKSMTKQIKVGYFSLSFLNYIFHELNRASCFPFAFNEIDKAGRRQPQCA